MEMDFTAQEVFPVYVAPTTVVAVRHTLMLDLITVSQMTAHRPGKCDLNTMSGEDWAKKTNR